MPLSLAALSRGDVLACGASLFVVHQIDAVGVQLLRALPLGGARYRADVRPEHWSDIAAAGVPQQDIVVRCAVVRRESLSGFTRLGQVSRALQARLTVAVAREFEARRIEATPSMKSTLQAVGGVGSRGRKVGRQNAT